VLVLWCWCCGAVVLVLVLVRWCCGVVVLWCWSSRVSGRPVLQTQYCFIPPPEFWCIDTSLHAFDDQLLASWVAWPARLVLGRYLCVSHVDKINTLIIINSISILTVTATCITLVAFPFAFSLCADDQKNEEERKKDLKIKIV
jgi:hypothetical protein